MADILEQMADSVPDRMAVMTEERDWTYREVDERATRLAHHLASLGVGRDDHVAVHARNCIEWVDAFFACFKVRAVPVNVNYRYLREELLHVYRDSGSVLAIVAPEYAEAVTEIEGEVDALERVVVLGDEYDASLAASSAERSFGPRSGDDHYIVFTGGTTGLPKGVLWRQEDIVCSALNALRGGAAIESVEQLGEEAAANENPVRLCTAGPLMHGGSQWILGNTLVAGSTFVLYTRPSFDARAYLDLCERSRTNSLVTLGDAMARPVVDALLEHPDRWDLGSLFIVSNGGAPLSAAVRADIREVLPHCLINDTYGSSEAGTTGTRIDDGRSRTAPVFNVGPDVMVVDEGLQPLPPGRVGMLARSGHIPLGYLNDPEKTAATFKEIDGRRWALPGDAARVEDDGSITVLGRGSTTINTGGEKVHPEEVEGVLLEHHDVFDAAVVGTPHERWGEQVTALVRLRPGSTVSEAELSDHVRQRIASYKAPKVVLIVDEVPRTPASKVDYPAAFAGALERLGISRAE